MATTQSLSDASAVCKGSKKFEGECKASLQYPIKQNIGSQKVWQQEFPRTRDIVGVNAGSIDAPKEAMNSCIHVWQLTA